MKKRLIPLILGILALVAALLGTNYWQKHYLAGVSTIQIPVPKADIPPYTLLSADLFVLQEYPRALTDQGSYILSTTDLDGRISAGSLLVGLPIPGRMVVSPEKFRLADPTLEVISLPADASRAAGAQIQVGEDINIYCLKPAPTQNEQEPVTPAPKPEVTFIARVPVVAALSDNGQPLSAGDQNSQPQPLKILVVAAPHETVQTILDAFALVEHEGAILWVTLATP